MPQSLDRYYGCFQQKLITNNQAYITPLNTCQKMVQTDGNKLFTTAYSALLATNNAQI